MFSTSTRGWVGKRAGRPLRCHPAAARLHLRAPPCSWGCCCRLPPTRRQLDLDDEVGERVGAERERRKPRHRSPPSLPSRAVSWGHWLAAARLQRRAAQPHIGQRGQGNRRGGERWRRAPLPPSLRLPRVRRSCGGVAEKKEAAVVGIGR